MKNTAKPENWAIRIGLLVFFALAGSGLWLHTRKVEADENDKSDMAAGPPVAPVRPVTEEYFGQKVVDPYRYMENLKDPEVQKWLKEQDDYTRAVLGRIPGRAVLLGRIKELDQSAPYRVFDVQRMRGEKYFYQKRMANENVSKLYVRDGLNGPEKLLVDPERLITDPQTHYTLNYYVPSLDSRYVAYGISQGGSEDASIHVLDALTGRDMGESIDRSWYGGIVWMPDSKSFLHIRFQEMKPGMDAKERRLKSRVYLHRVGTGADEDVAVFGYGVNPDIPLEPSDSSSVFIDPRTTYAVACVYHGFENDMSCFSASAAEVGSPDIKWQKLFDEKEKITGVDFREDDLYLLSHKNAPRSRVLRTTFSHPDIANALEVIGPGQAVINSVFAGTDALYVFESDGPTDKLLRMPYKGGAVEQVKLPTDGNVSIGGGDPAVAGFVLYQESWTQSYKIYQYEAASKRVVDLGLQPAGPFDAPSDLEAMEVKVRSYDGEMVPLSIVEKKGTKTDGSHPTLLGGYGAYAIKEGPFFDPRWIAWLERGGILAFAHVRGGGEYGEEWHEAGMLNKKPNTWKDFIACAEYLREKGYTASERMAGQAGSAGGILIGRAFTERPELFAAALDDVGLSDMIRDMFSPDGPLNVPEYGSLENAEGFRNLQEISAYYHVKDGEKYPAILLTTGINDPRVVPWEPGKMAARLQAATGSGKPVLLRVDYQGGHGGIGATRAQYEELLADQWSFLLWQFGVPGFQPAKSGD
jgi:prolyl oligopeptidase